MRNYLFSFLIVFLFPSVIFGQDSANVNINMKYSNSNLKWNIIRGKLANFESDSFDFEASQLYITINWTDDDERELRAKSKENWLNLLKDEKCDFAANIILYCLYNRVATFFFFHKDTTYWRERQKQSDFEFWEKTLK